MKRYFQWMGYLHAGSYEIDKSYKTLQNAKLTDDTSPTTAELKAYESPAKAVLMADTKTTLNTGESDTPSHPSHRIHVIS